MVQTLLLVARKVAHLEDYITMYHIEIMNIVNHRNRWYGNSSLCCRILHQVGTQEVDMKTFTYLSPGATTGPYWWAFWALIICNFSCSCFFLVQKIKNKYYLDFLRSINHQHRYVVLKDLTSLLSTFLETTYQVLGRCLSQRL